jgi:hypothetical protein
MQEQHERLPIARDCIRRVETWGHSVALEIPFLMRIHKTRDEEIVQPSFPRVSLSFNTFFHILFSPYSHSHVFSLLSNLCVISFLLCRTFALCVCSMGTA